MTSIHAALFTQSVAAWTLLLWWPGSRATCCLFAVASHAGHCISCKLLLGSYLHSVFRFVFTLAGYAAVSVAEQHELLRTTTGRPSSSSATGRRMSQEVRAPSENVTGETALTDLEEVEDWALKVVIIVACLIVGLCAIGYWTPRSFRLCARRVGGRAVHFDDVQRLSVKEYGPEDDALGLGTSATDDATISFALSDSGASLLLTCSSSAEDDVEVTEAQGTTKCARDAGDDHGLSVDAAPKTVAEALADPTADAGCMTKCAWDADGDHGLSVDAATKTVAEVQAGPTADAGCMTKCAWDADKERFVCTWCQLPSPMPIYREPQVQGTWELRREHVHGARPWMHCIVIRGAAAFTSQGARLKLKETEDRGLKLEGSPIFTLDGELCRRGKHGQLHCWRPCGIAGEANGPRLTAPKPIFGGRLNGTWEMLPQFREGNPMDNTYGRIKVRRGTMVRCSGGERLEIVLDGRGRAYLNRRQLFLISDQLIMQMANGNFRAWRRPLIEDHGEGEDLPRRYLVEDAGTDKHISLSGYPERHVGGRDAATVEKCARSVQTVKTFACACDCGIEIGFPRPVPKYKPKKRWIGVLGRGTPVRGPT